MQFEKKECENASSVLKQAKEALAEKSAVKLKDLSNRTIHSSCSYQDAGSITSAVLIYALSKLIEREDYKKIKNWDKFVKKFNASINLAILALDQNNSDMYAKYMEQARKILESTSLNLKPYIEEVLRKASINKGGRLYEHGISLGQTARLLGITTWELSEYTGQEKIEDSVFNETINIKKRAKIALEFFS